jgi:hypothetical protein
MTTVQAALAEVMREVGHVAKGDRNSAQNFNFRGIDAVVNAVGPALRKHGVIVTPDVRSCDYGTVIVGKNRTEMGHVRLVVAYTFHGPDGSTIVTSAPGEAMDAGDKATPKAMSVAFRTALLQALALPTDEPDPDASTYQRVSADPAASDDAVNEIGLAIDALDETHKQQLREVWAANGLPRPADLREKHVTTVLQLIRQVNAGDYDPKPETP